MGPHLSTTKAAERCSHQISILGVEAERKGDDYWDTWWSKTHFKDLQLLQCDLLCLQAVSTVQSNDLQYCSDVWKTSKHISDEVREPDQNVYILSQTLLFTLTCADEHDIILPVLCLDPVHYNLSQPVRSVGFYKHRLAQGGIHRSPHQRVVASKLQHWIGEVLCAAKLSAWLVGDFTRALERWRQGWERCGEPKEKRNGIKTELFW